MNIVPRSSMNTCAGTESSFSVPAFVFIVLRVPLVSFRRYSPPKSSSTISVRPRSSVGRVTVDLIRRWWVYGAPFVNLLFNLFLEDFLMIYYLNSVIYNNLAKRLNYHK